MSTCEMATELWPNKVRTKIVGTTFEGRQDILAQCRRQNVKSLRLVSEPMNKYDPYAVAVVADLRDDNGSPKTVQLGYLSNSDRVCSDCGQVVGGAYFENSKIIECPKCCDTFGFEDKIIVQGPDGTACIECPICGIDVELHSNKLVMCPSCKGTDFGRAGIATRFSRAIAAGVSYSVIVADYTGGQTGTGGKMKTLGCNIRIEKLKDKG